MDKNKLRVMKNQIRIKFKKLIFKMINYDCLFLCDNVFYSFFIIIIICLYVLFCGVVKQMEVGSVSWLWGWMVFSVEIERY